MMETSIDIIHMKLPSVKILFSMYFTYRLLVSWYFFFCSWALNLDTSRLGGIIVLYLHQSYTVLLGVHISYILSPSRHWQRCTYIHIYIHILFNYHSLLKERASCVSVISLQLHMTFRVLYLQVDISDYFLQYILRTRGESPIVPVFLSPVVWLITFYTCGIYELQCDVRWNNKYLTLYITVHFYKQIDT